MRSDKLCTTGQFSLSWFYVTAARILTRNLAEWILALRGNSCRNLLQLALVSMIHGLSRRQHMGLANGEARSGQFIVVDFTTHVTHWLVQRCFLAAIGSCLGLSRALLILSKMLACIVNWLINFINDTHFIFFLVLRWLFAHFFCLSLSLNFFTNFLR